MKVLQILFLISVLALNLFAQKAALIGTVYDAVGAVIPKAKVTAVNEKGDVFAAETNDEGTYSLNLHYNNYDAKTSSANFKISKYNIFVDLTDRGFEKFVIRDFKFVPTNSGKMYCDIALDSSNPEPCGYGGNGCLQEKSIKTEKIKLSGIVLQKHLEKSSKEQNKNKRKNNK